MKWSEGEGSGQGKMEFIEHLTGRLAENVLLLTSSDCAKRGTTENRTIFASRQKILCRIQYKLYAVTSIRDNSGIQHNHRNRSHITRQRTSLTTATNSDNDEEEDRKRVAINNPGKGIILSRKKMAREKKKRKSTSKTARLQARRQLKSHLLMKSSVFISVRRS